MLPKFYKYAGLVFLLVGLGNPAAAQNTRELDFTGAKKILRTIWNKQRVEAYCGCSFDEKLNVSSDCGFKPTKESRRATRIEFEHVVPAADYGRQRPCWREADGDSRTYCRENDPVFRAMEGDPINLIPAIGSLNAYRSNYRYGEVPGEAREFGSCDFEMSPPGAGRIVEPPANVKGDIARITFYFSDRYNHRLSPAQRKLFEAWDRMDPIDEWEFERSRLIEKATGYRNEYVLGPADAQLVPRARRSDEPIIIRSSK